MKNTHGRVLLLVKLQTCTCNFNKSNTSPWVFSTSFKFCQWYQIAQHTTATFKHYLKPNPRKSKATLRLSLKKALLIKKRTVPQNLILGSLLFLIYINKLSSNAKLFALDTPLFSVVHNEDGFATERNYDLAKIRHWPHQWKFVSIQILVNKLKRSFSNRKVNNDSYPPLTFNNIVV